MTKVFDQAHGDWFAAYRCDAVEFAATLPDNSVDFSIYSPPFASLYIYSQSERDMGNVGSEQEFAEQYRPLVSALYQATKPGRLTAVHCSDLPRTKSTHGYIDLYDFPADIRKVHEEAGWTYHSRITVWKDPVVEMQRTKALGLLYKQLQKDATRSRQGMPDYVLVFRKTPESEDKAVPVGQDANTFPVAQWQQWASPVWMDIDQTDVLNVRAARDAGDEKHVCPLQLDLIERAIRLWSNPGDVVFSPFMGIGSEGFAAIKAGRHFLGTELKDSYFRQAAKYLGEAEAERGNLFAAPASPQPGADVSHLMEGLE
ncbi:site-specific DNA-methyltransferase [Xanthobacteraceae bacterium Astr-EGSB]|uniref:DNA-methyltransferase n=1 Tax=Astrobacterium formosum TaxID=3069710 RepID=UPI0027B3C323|nr:site-specific DNA-methyltransferase [Xanthobacteraceae bacterium Astr-EGSB]